MVADAKTSPAEQATDDAQTSVQPPRDDVPGAQVTSESARTPAQVPVLASDTIELELAHHLTWPANTAPGVRHPKAEDYGPGDTVTVTRDDARAIIAAGYAAVDADDPQAVLRALQLPGRTPPGVTIDYGATGQGVAELGAGPAAAPILEGAAGEAGLEPRDGRNDATPDKTWLRGELVKLARAWRLDDDGTKVELLQRLEERIEARSAGG